MKKSSFKIFLLLLLVFICFSCASSRDKVEVFEPVKYTEADAVEYEIKSIRSIMEKENVKALFRACLLKDNTDNQDEVLNLYSDCLESVLSSYKQAVDEKKWVKALSYFNSLKAASYADYSKLELQKEKLISLINDKKNETEEKDKNEIIINDDIINEK